MAKSALIWSAVLAVVGGGVLYLRGRRRWVHVQVSIEVGDLADRLGVKDEVARFLASSKEDVAWHPCPRVVLAEGEVPSAERLHGLLASSLAATEPFQIRAVDLVVADPAAQMTCPSDSSGYPPQLCAVCDGESAGRIEKVRLAVLEATALAAGAARESVVSECAGGLVPLGLLGEQAARVREWITRGPREAGRGGGALRDLDHDEADEFFYADDASHSFVRHSSHWSPQAGGGSCTVVAVEAVPAVDARVRVSQLAMSVAPRPTAESKPRRAPAGDRLHAPLSPPQWVQLGGALGAQLGVGWQRWLVARHRRELSAQAQHGPLYDYVGPAG